MNTTKKYVVENELWIDIPGYKGLYQVSNLGRVKSLDRKVTQKHYSGIIAHHTYKGKLLIPHKQNTGYYFANLKKDGQTKKEYIHRLVAISFIDNPNNYTYINHIDGNKTNNNVNNLEWCTQSYNIKYAYDNGTKTPPNMKKVKQIKNGQAIKIYNSLTEAGRETNICWTNISKCCRKLRKQAGGYQWEYTE